MRKLRVIFMGSPQFAVPSLQALANSAHNIVAVVTRPDKPSGRGYRLSATPIKELAIEMGMKILQPVALNKDEFVNKIKSLEADLIINVAFGRIIPFRILELPPLKAINLHPSLLPLYRGAAPIQRAIINGDKVTGNSIIYMVEELDAGDIILQEEEIIHIDDTTESLGNRLAENGAVLLTKAVNMFTEGNVNPYPQDNNSVTLAPPLDQTDEIINWNRSAEEIHNQVRAFYPRPGAYTKQERHRLKIWKTSLGKYNSRVEKPGTVLSLQDMVILVQTGDGILALEEVQQEGKKRLSASDYWRGSRLKSGYIFT